jgi:Tfp pilus assembly protein PilX
MVVALLVMIALAVIGLAGTRLALTHHRISGNTVRADTAFAAAEAGVQNALAYLNANRTVIASTATGGWRNTGSTPYWIPCAGETALPCGDGTGNLYNNTWLRHGPLPNQQSAGSGHTVSTWVMSNTLTAPALDVPYLGCLNVGLTAVLPTLTDTLVGTVNTLLNTLGTLLGQPGLGLPVNLCLPLNFSQMPPAVWPSSRNPSVTIVSTASHASDPMGGEATVQQVAGTTNLFAGVPPASLMVAGTASLSGDIRIWGNMRPPTVEPMDFSVLNLNDVAGLNVSSLLLALVGSTVGPLTSSINISFAPLLSTNTSEILLFDWNATFPLSIWSSGTTTLASGPVGLSILSGVRTCLPQYNGTVSSPCTPLSEAVSIPANSILLLVPPLSVNLPLKLPDVQDPQNLVSTVASLISGTVPAFPADLFNFTFGYPSAQSTYVEQIATPLTNCTGVSTGAFYWVTGNCTLTGTIGSAAAPVTIVTTGNVTLAAGADIWGVLYLRGIGAKSFAGPASGTRAQVHGTIVSEGSLTATGNFNVAYDVNVIRTAGYRAGSFAPVPGGWSDALTGP